MALWPNRSASLLGSAQETDHFARGSCVAFDLAPLASSQRRSLSCSFSAILSRRSVGPHLYVRYPGQNQADEFLSPGVFRLLNSTVCLESSRSPSLADWQENSPRRIRLYDGIAHAVPTEGHSIDLDVSTALRTCFRYERASLRWFRMRWLKLPEGSYRSEVAPCALKCWLSQPVVVAIRPSSLNEHRRPPGSKRRRPRVGSIPAALYA
jgi:hypothetical protein